LENRRVPENRQQAIQSMLPGLESKQELEWVSRVQV
jgi:hypothetical protein